MERYAEKINVHPLSLHLGPHGNMIIKNTDDLNTLLLEISHLHSYTSLGLSLNNEISLSLLFSRFVDVPVLALIPPPHVRSTGAVRSVTSILLPSFPTEPQGTGTHASRKSKGCTILWVYYSLSSLSLFWSHVRIASVRGTLSSSEWDLNAKSLSRHSACNVTDLIVRDPVPCPWSNTHTNMHVCVLTSAFTVFNYKYNVL